ncbi:MAG: hypothetical protein AAGA48_39210 [Myxococcota bacterium]
MTSLMVRRAARSLPGRPGTRWCARFGALASEAERQIDEADEDALNDFVERFPSFEGSLDEFLA